LNQRLEDTKRSGNLTENTKKKALRESLAALHSKMERCVKALEMEIDAIERINHTAIVAYRSQLEDVKKRLEDRENEVTTTLASKNHIKIMQDQTGLAAQLDDVARSLAVVRAPIKMEYQVEGICQLQTTIIKRLGSAHLSRSDSKDCIRLLVIEIG
jgi:hypothetical protein